MCNSTNPLHCRHCHHTFGNADTFYEHDCSDYIEPEPGESWEAYLRRIEIAFDGEEVAA